MKVYPSPPVVEQPAPKPGAAQLQWVIHAVGPVWSGGDCDEATLLRQTYYRSLELARRLEVQRLAFPAISCGAYRFPVDDAARIAVEEVAAFLESGPSPQTVILCSFEPRVLKAYHRALARRKSLVSPSPRTRGGAHSQFQALSNALYAIR